MIPQLSNKNCAFGGTVNNAVLDAVFKRFWFAGPLERLMHDLTDQPVDAFKHLPVGLLPVEVVLPGVPRKDQLHSASLRVLPPPRSSSAMDSRSRLAFFGTRRRYALPARERELSENIGQLNRSRCIYQMVLIVESFWIVVSFVISGSSRYFAVATMILSCSSGRFLRSSIASRTG